MALTSCAVAIIPAATGCGDRPPPIHGPTTVGAVATRVVALLRGINVGGHNRLAMATLRSIGAEAGATDVATYVQSGNLVATTTLAPSNFGEALTRRLSSETGLDIPVITRSARQWHDIAAANPFPDEALADPKSVHVAFFGAPLGDDARAFDAEPFAPDRLRVSRSGLEFYMYTSEGLSRSKLAAKISRNTDFREGTMRNWSTVQAIANLL
jgi:uncharacterized protein (DUF1697 family)